MKANFLFDRDFLEAREQLLRRLQLEIQDASTTDLADSDYTERLKRKYEFHPIELDIAQATDELDEGPNGTIVVTLSIPFTGSAELVRYRASQYKLNAVLGSVITAKPAASHSGHVVLNYQSHDADPEQYMRWKAAQVLDLEERLRWINNDVTVHYGAMVQTIERGIAERQDRIAKLDAFRKGIA